MNRNLAGTMRLPGAMLMSNDFRAVQPSLTDSEKQVPHAEAQKKESLIDDDFAAG